MLRIICVKAGEKYSAKWVNILADMIRRNLPEGFLGEFICFTDDATGLDANINVRGLPSGLVGWFNKLYLFKDYLFDDGDRIIFFDLDMLIIGALDHIVKYDGSFAILRDFYRANGLNSSVVAWQANTVGYIWDEYRKAGFPDVVGGDQAWVEKFSDRLHPEILQDVFPKSFVSFKRHCNPMPPRGSKVVAFHGFPKPDDCKADWVKAIWAIDGGQGFDLEQICNTADEKIVANVTYAISVDIPWMEKGAPHDGQAVIVGGAPSLRGKIEEIRWRQNQGQKIFATNNAAAFLLEHAIVADIHVLLDGRQENVSFLQSRHPKTDYYIASQCDKSIFDELDDYSVTVWHPLIPIIEDMTRDDARSVHLVGCGSTVCLKSIGIAHCLGYRTFHLFGIDSSYSDGAHHAYEQPQNDDDRVLDVQIGERLFKAAPWMVSQTNEFQDLAAYLANEGCIITVAGDGLLPHVARTMMSENQVMAADIRANAILRHLPEGRVVGAEIGVFAGDLSARLLTLRPDLTLYMIDSWIGDGKSYIGKTGDWHAALTQETQNAYKARTVAVTKFADNRARILDCTSERAAGIVKDASIDFVFIDADHSYEGCKADINLWLPKLKPNGLLCGHDYDHPDFPKFGVKRAVDEFAVSHGATISLGDNFTWFIHKNSLKMAA